MERQKVSISEPIKSEPPVAKVPKPKRKQSAVKRPGSSGSVWASVK